jgi:hypothetical protein
MMPPVLFAFVIKAVTSLDITGAAEKIDDVVFFTVSELYPDALSFSLTQRLLFGLLDRSLSSLSAAQPTFNAVIFLFIISPPV